MRRALVHAARGQGRTTPNPMVGAVVVSPAGVVVGQGWHQRAGAPHAEIHAIDSAGSRAHGATLYVTLEPCCHVGRTGPCTRRIIEAGITRVVAAMRDPDQRVSGFGFAELRAQGIVVDEGICHAEAQRLNQAFVSVKTLGRPLIIFKAATGLDARISTGPAERTDLTSEEANRKTHLLRASVDALGVGSETILTDDPLLTVRACYRARPLVRVIFDRRLRVLPRARVFSTLDQGPVIILTSGTAFDGAADRVRALESTGATVLSTSDLHHAVRQLLDWDVSALLVEGGARLHAALWDAGLVDRLHLIVAPRMLGPTGVKLLDGRPFARSEVSVLTVEPRGADIWIEADVHRYR